MTAKDTVRLAADKKTIIPAFNIPHLPMVQPVVQAIKDENSIAMVEVARLEWVKFKAESLNAVAEEYFRFSDSTHTLLHLDHVPAIDEDNKTVEYLTIIEQALDAGYQSVMVDASRLPIESNISATLAVSEKARKFGVAVEAELGAVVGHESRNIDMDYEELFSSKLGFTNIEEARHFACESGCDWLSVAVGNIHGAIATSALKRKKPEARLDIKHLAALYEATGSMPLVLHGGSGIKREYILKAIDNGVAKINVGTEIRQTYEFALDEKPGDIEFAQEKVYERVSCMLRDFFEASGSRMKLFG